MFSRKARRRFKQLLLWAEILFILVMGAGVGVVAGAFYQMSKLLPPDRQIGNYQPVAGTKLYSSDGVLLGSIAQENRDPVEIKKIPKRLQDAIVAIEDSRFYEHSGIDFHGLARALWQNVRSGNLTEQGGSTLYPAMAQRATSVEVLRILISIGPTETMHFQTWADKAGNAPPLTAKDPVTGVSVTFPDLNSSPFGGENFQTNLIMPEPCPFLSRKLPPCSIIRPTETKKVAMGALNFLTAMGLFIGQSPAFFALMRDLAMDADRARREDN